MSDWFPRPGTPAALVPLGPSGELDTAALFERLRSPTASEWRDKVGVSSPLDGSAKGSTRLLCAQGWVFKTDVSLAEPSREAAQAKLSRPLELATRVELWHPDKRWLLLRDREQGLWWPVSACPRMTSLRAVDSWERFAPLWIAALSFGLERALRHGLGLDLNPANFGLCMGAGPGAAPGELWYLDDEVYTQLDMGELAAAILGRVPEWPALPESAWRSFGMRLRAQLEPVLSGAGTWDELLEHLREQLLTERWEAAREALIDGISEGGPIDRARAGTRRDPAPPRLSAVIADVHANLPALEAVIAAGEAAGVDSWIFLGDAVGYGPQPCECIARISALPGLVAVRGNHDHMACFGVDPRANRLARAAMLYTRGQLGRFERRWLMSLPVEQLGPDWQALHGAPADPQRFHAYVYAMSFRANLAVLAGSGRRLCFHGHTHVPMIYSTIGGVAQGMPAREGMELELSRDAVYLLNPGSVGQPRDGDPRAAFMLWDRQADRVSFRRCSYELEPVLAALRAARLPEDLGTRLELGR